jgi:hypothetical protein
MTETRAFLLAFRQHLIIARGLIIGEAVIDEFLAAQRRSEPNPAGPCCCHLPDRDPSICPVHRPGIHALVHGCPLCGRTADHLHTYTLPHDLTQPATHTVTPLPRTP